MRGECVRKWSSVMFGLMLTTMIACNPIAEDDPRLRPTQFPLDITPTIFIAQRPTDPSPPTEEPVPTPEPIAETNPTLGGTPLPPQGWQWIGGESLGAQIAVPNVWVDMAARLDEMAFTNRLGLPTLFAADLERTGLSLLGGKTVDTGAYVMGLLTSYDLATNSPVEGLAVLQADLGQSVTAVSEITPFIRVEDGLGQTAVASAYIEVEGSIPGLPPIVGQMLHTRILLFTFGSNQTNASSSQIAFFFGSDVAHWDTYETLFSQMAETIIIHQLRPSLRLGEGTVVVVGDLTDGANVTRLLNQGGRDLWTFRSEGAQFVTFQLHPESANLDLSLQLFDPTGQTIADVDNGYAGDTEIVTDVFLNDPGVYIAAVNDFSSTIGRYQLQLAITSEPQFGEGGTIHFGESIQNRLQAGKQHIWTFSGTANQLISVVLTPGSETFDAILDLYGPDGQRLVALDEGFSGDAEVIAGYALPVTGPFSIMVRNFAEGGDGTYALALDEGGESTLNFFDAGDLAYGQTQQETLRPNEAQAWFFNGTEGDVVQVKASPLDDQLDLEIWLLDPNVVRLATTDDHLVGQTEAVEVSLPHDGQYVVLVRDYYGLAGAYEIQLMAMQSQTAVSAGTLNLGQTVVGQLATGTRAAWSFEGQAEMPIQITLAPTQPTHDLVLSLLTPDGETALEVDEHGAGEAEQVAQFVLPTNGRWQLVVEEFFAQPADYQLTLNFAP